MGNIAILKKNVNVNHCRKDRVLPTVEGSNAEALNLYTDCNETCCNNVHYIDGQHEHFQFYSTLNIP
jgi:hypothetical protein